MANKLLNHLHNLIQSTRKGGCLGFTSSTGFDRMDLELAEWVEGGHAEGE